MPKPKRRAGEYHNIITGTFEGAARPAWLKKGVDPAKLESLRGKLRDSGLESVCEQASCPNISECFGRGVATFLILGKTCTRACAFCGVRKGKPVRQDENEPARVAQAARDLEIGHVVVTSVTRDDLPDGGAMAFAHVTVAIRRLDPAKKIELLVPDFAGSEPALRVACSMGPDILGHNVETVPRLYSLRKGADYRRSLDLLTRAKRLGMKTKSAIMVGMGEKEEEVLEVMRDLRQAGCDFLSVGQYLQPTKKHHPVKEYIKPERFDFYAAEARLLGFAHAAAAPFVRSSYMADRYLERVG